MLTVQPLIARGSLRDYIFQVTKLDNVIIIIIVTLMTSIVYLAASCILAGKFSSA